jgi:anti-anti-sigma factor
MSYIEQNLQPDERVVFQTNLHSAILLPPAMAAVMALLLVPAAFAASTRSLPASAVLAAFSLTLLGWAFRSGLSALTRYRNAELVVTNQRIVLNLGRSRRRATFENRLGAIERIDVDPGILGGVLGYGTVLPIEVGGRSKGRFPYVVSPHELKAAVEQQKQVAKAPAKTLDIGEERAGAVTILKLSGRVVFERSEELENKLTSLITSGRTKLVIHGSQVRAIDSAGIGALARGYREAMEHGGGLVVASPSSRMSEALSMIRIPIQMFSTEQEAIGSFG